MLLKIGICEDDPTQRRNLERLVQSWGEEMGHKISLFSYENGEAFLWDWSSRMDFDLILLDIDLGPGGNGMELARRIRSRDGRAAILFITGLAEYMSQGYDVRACHFLVKPLEEQKLYGALEKALAETEKKETYLLLEEETGAERIPVSRILYGEAFSHRTALWLTPEREGEEPVCREAGICLGDLEEQLPPAEFFRCHRSYLVHLPYLRRIDRTQAFLDWDRVVPVSRGKRAELYQAFLAYFRDNTGLPQPRKKHMAEESGI